MIMFNLLKTFISRVGEWVAPAAADREFEHELEAHLDMLTEENVGRGMSPEAARRAARIRLGGVTQLKEVNRDLRGLPAAQMFVQDARYACRMLRRNRGFTTVAVLTLALGIGANTAIFSVVYAVVLKPLPYAQSEQLFNVFQAKPQDGVGGTGWSYPNFTELRDHNDVFSDMVGAQKHQLTLTGRGEPTVVDTSVVTAGFFSLFGEKPLSGRTFTVEDGNRGAAAVVILGEDLWRGYFNADPEVIGSSIDLDKKSFTVVGIMPSAFRFPSLTKPQQLWIPLAQDPLFGGWLDQRKGHWLQVTGRLKPGVSIAQARAQLDAIDARLATDFPAENGGWKIRMVPLKEMILATPGRHCSSCSAPSAWCCSSRAPTSPTCFSPAQPLAHERWRFGPRSGRDGPGLSASCSVRRSSSASSAASSASRSHTGVFRPLLRCCR